MIRVPTHRPPTHPGEMLLEEFLMENNDMPSAKSPKHNEQQTSSEPKPKTTQLQIVKNVPPKHFPSVDWEEKDLEMDD